MSTGTTYRRKPFTNGRKNAVSNGNYQQHTENRLLWRHEVIMIIGIDPGITGAVAILNDDGSLHDVFDMPVIQPGKRKRINSSGLARLIEENMSEFVTVAYIEQVGAMPGQGTASMFSFGHAAGVADGVLAALSIPIEYVTPQIWKKNYSLNGKDKEASRAKGIQLYPQASLARKKDVGRAEAILIARYGFDQYRTKEAA